MEAGFGARRKFNLKTNEKTRLTIDTKGVCLLCFQPVPNDNREDDIEGEVNKKVTASQFQILARYLNINLPELFNISDKFPSGGLLKNFQLQVTFCERCTHVINKFFLLYQDLEMTLMLVNSFIQQIRDLVARSDRNHSLVEEYWRRTKMGQSSNGVKEAIVVENIREMMVETCSLRLERTGPRVRMSQMNDDVTRKALERLKRLKNEKKMTMSYANDNIDTDRFDDIVPSPANSLEPDDDDANFGMEPNLTAEPSSPTETSFIDSLLNSAPPRRKPYTRHTKNDDKKLFTSTEIGRYKNCNGHWQVQYKHFCKVCKKSVTNKTIHRRMHIRGKGFPCPHCNRKEFLSHGALQAHLFIDHCEMMFREFKRPALTEEQFLIAVQLLFHDIKVTRIPRDIVNKYSYSHQCPHCPLDGFPSKFSIREHMVCTHKEILVGKLEELQTDPEFLDENKSLLFKKKVNAKAQVISVSNNVERERKKANTTHSNETLDNDNDSENENHPRNLNLIVLSSSSHRLPQENGSGSEVRLPVPIKLEREFIDEGSSSEGETSQDPWNIANSDEGNPESEETFRSATQDNSQNIHGQLGDNGNEEEEMECSIDPSLLFPAND